MATGLKLAANANNAALSTGPRTVVGKARARHNALRHGLRAELPVLPGERAEDWQAHHQSIMESLAPAGGLEMALAERVAFCLWRLRRVAVYEAAVTALGMLDQDDNVRPPAVDPDAGSVAEEVTLADRLAAAEQQLAEAREALAGWKKGERLLAGLAGLADDVRVSGAAVQEVLSQVTFTCWAWYDGSGPPDPNDRAWLTERGVPPDEADPYRWAGWTAGLVRRSCEQVAATAQVGREVLLARALADGRAHQVKTRARARALETTVGELRRQAEVRERGRREGRMLPDEATLSKVMRYEGHLNRQLMQALHTLERLQAARVGLPVPPPAALDVTVDAPAGAAPVLQTTAERIAGPR